MEQGGTNQAVTPTSTLRIRVGVLLLLVWWLPIWLLSPAISSLLGINSDSGQHAVLVVIVCVQTALGALGAFLTGKEIVKLVKKVPKKRVPKTLWNILRHGEYEEPPPTA